jgi:hypothetical protein
LGKGTSFLYLQKIPGICQGVKEAEKMTIARRPFWVAEDHLLTGLPMLRKLMEDIRSNNGLIITR